MLDTTQELAMNVVWTQEEFNRMSDGHLDYGTTRTEQTVCKVISNSILDNKSFTRPGMNNFDGTQTCDFITLFFGI